MLAVKEERLETIQLLEYALLYFNEIENDFNKIIYIKNQLLDLQSKKSNGYKYLFVVFVFIGVVFYSTGIKFDFISMVLPYLLLVFLSFILIFLSKYEMKRKNIKYSKELINIFSNILSYHNSFEYKEILNIKYCNPKTIKYFLTIINEGRADSLKEAINIFCHERERDEDRLRNEMILSKIDRFRKENNMLSLGIITSIIFSSDQ